MSSNEHICYQLQKTWAFAVCLKLKDPHADTTFENQMETLYLLSASLLYLSISFSFFSVYLSTPPAPSSPWTQASVSVLFVYLFVFVVVILLYEYPP